MEAGERTRSLAEAIDGLPEMMRTCLMLRYFHELSLQEAAVFLGLSVNTVKTHVRHIYITLDAADRNDAVERAARLGLL